MSFKVVPSMTVIAATEWLNVQEIGAWGEKLTPLMMAEIERYGLSTAGPWLFISYGRDGDTSRKFRHDYCVPVSNPERYRGAFQVRTLDPFPCFFTLHTGMPSEENLRAGYGGVAEAITQAGREFSGESREVWHGWTSADSTANAFEIQIGVK
ncbi:GyrI-like domain-containing protein [Cystobacter ferrugineus]|nr:GyrI-like domain-containing protein [Cystobacter ferrugineus]